MAFADGATIVGLSLGVSVGVEVLLWLWLYRTRSFEAMKAAVEKTRKKGARDPRRSGRGGGAGTGTPRRRTDRARPAQSTPSRRSGG